LEVDCEKGVKSRVGKKKREGEKGILSRKNGGGTESFGWGGNAESFLLSI